MGTAIKHAVPDWVKPSFVIFDFWALWHSRLRQSVKMSKITNDSLTQSGRGYFITVHKTTVGIKGLRCRITDQAVSIDDERTAAAAHFHRFHQRPADTRGSNDTRHPRSQLHLVKHQLTSHQQLTQLISGSCQLSSHALGTVCVHDVRLSCVSRQQSTIITHRHRRLCTHNHSRKVSE